MAGANYGCGLAGKIWRHNGEQLEVAKPPPPAPGPHVIIFAMDGGCYEQLMNVVRSGAAPNIAALLGKEKGAGLFEHGYSAPNALSMLPSSTIADWSSVFTGDPPAYDGVTGDEWFIRETGQFFAPVPISVKDTSDWSRTITDGLVGAQLKSPTMFELVGLRTYVSLGLVYRGTTIYTTVAPASFATLMTDLVTGKLKGETAEKSVSATIDRASVQKLIDTINQHGLPNLQVVYFPGIDIFTHASVNPLEQQEHYLAKVTDPLIGQVLEVYRQKDMLGQTYVFFVSDHGHTPTMNDTDHMLGTGDDSPFGLVTKAGFRVRPPKLKLADSEQDYQAVLAYQGFMAYVYLADRSSCAKPGQRCDWRKPPRFEQDVMPVARAFYRTNRSGRPIARLKGTIDLIFARRPVGPGQDARPFEIYDGKGLVPIADYLASHRRPDLIELEQRMKWLGAGPYGNRAGDIVLLARSGMQVPIEKRYYFAAETHYSWHGSADLHDGNIPFILAEENGSGERLRGIVKQVADDSPTELDVTPLVRALLAAAKPAPPVTAQASP
ncbi:MAG TPA: alkaline phosphatase family protein [Candidatus Binataceae bacterium]|nr:alkaline phosphatase family protein [Candidatus Binataceae bacterium]